MLLLKYGQTEEQLIKLAFHSCVNAHHHFLNARNKLGTSEVSFLSINTRSIETDLDKFLNKDINEELLNKYLDVLIDYTKYNGANDLNYHALKVVPKYTIEN